MEEIKRRAINLRQMEIAREETRHRQMLAAAALVEFRQTCEVCNASQTVQAESAWGASFVFYQDGWRAADGKPICGSCIVCIAREVVKG